MILPSWLVQGAIPCHISNREFVRCFENALQVAIPSATKILRECDEVVDPCFYAIDDVCILVQPSIIRNGGASNMKQSPCGSHVFCPLWTVFLNGMDQNDQPVDVSALPEIKVVRRCNLLV